MSVDREELKRLAELSSESGDPYWYAGGELCFFSGKPLDEADSKLIAAANPTAILDLLAQLEAKEAEIARLTQIKNGLDSLFESAVADLSALRASRDADVERAIRLLMQRMFPDYSLEFYEVHAAAVLSQMKEPTE